ncbi:caspase-8 [Leuresthes tenuis]|uniref:caspase-8 n=1 Tax=Leuresthes tenuis TaxID=355514 RepID=UPI003B512F2E
MDFQKLLLEAGNALSGDEVKALAFLCKDLLSQNLNSVESADVLFFHLMDHDLLSSEQPQLLPELLHIIQRHRLLRHLGLAERESKPRSIISPYRKLLYNLSEEITVKDLRDIKFMLSKDLPRRKLEENVTTLEVFLEMERKDLISDTNLNKLEDIFASVHPALKEKIKHYKEQQGKPPVAPNIILFFLFLFSILHPTNPTVQEASRPRSSSVPSTSTQFSTPYPLPRTCSFDTEDLQESLPSTNSSNASLDFQKFGGICGSATHRGNILVKKDICTMERMPSQENKASAETNTETLGMYPMTSAKRGVCVIVNNHSFTKSTVSLNNREGTMADEKSLQEVFQWLDFEVQIHRDCDSKKILSVLHQLSRKDHSHMDCLVCCVLSHGKEGKVYGVDGNTVEIMKLMDPFDGQKCLSLVEKPKLFFIQACQGNKEQKPVETDSPVQSDARAVKYSIPSGADFLLGMATVPYHVSYRDRKSGTWYIQSLCRNLVQMVPREFDLVSILTKVNADVSKKTDYSGERKQMPQPCFTLREKVVFPIPKKPPPSLLD